ncbi:ATP-binding cassette domain-containing protein [Rhodoferax sp. 4810]|uniref:ATP-binding protein Uup n=1 Tax=Thiospirillum jenense TaxID=1653858 RepID=A0A839HE56_9GAMM|nr:ATP-binding cassette domain-containing protein [Thiospirillum jenense]MBB1074699.1 ATP-binding cassette domain-containing protein [Rhodoferax jenense]MBB1125457.1 ATP-binding cassette domain-containing protein [Thiospirillum jenense]
MPVLSLRGVTLGYGGAPLLDAINLDLERGERICLIGRNGVGKSTLLKLIAGELPPDSGTIHATSGLRLARLEQEAEINIALNNDQRVLDLVAAGLGELSTLISDYYRLSHQLSTAATDAELTQLAVIGQQLESHGGWEIEQRAERVISRLGLDADARYYALSGGLRRRVLLARALIRDPDVLLLDEPTNHLDIDTIDWLEEFLLNYHGTLLFITHDRRFLRRLATRILELDRGQLTDWPGDYTNFTRRREERLHAEAMNRARFEQQLATEEIWIRQGIQARRTRNEGRVRALEMMRRERAAQRQQLGTARMRLDSSERSGRLVIEAQAVQFNWSADQPPLITNLNTIIMRGDRVGIIGANGAGKTTLLKLLLGELTPTQGELKRGSNLQIAYFDQLRAQLNPTANVCDNLAGGRDRIEIAGRSQHVLSYLKDFLFTPERARQPVMALSGGERNRLLLAKLFSLPANVLVLDEPTNDLDSETLELLEELLHQFDGTLLLVSHDREFLDHLVTTTLVLEGQGRVNEYVGGYTDWLRQRPPSPSLLAPIRPAVTTRSTTSAPVKLTFKQQRELAALPAQIELLEQEQSLLRQRLLEPGLYRQAGNEVAGIHARLLALEVELNTLYQQWENLETVKQASGG